MRDLGKYAFWLTGSCLAALAAVACSSVEEKPSSATAAPAAAAKAAAAPARKVKAVEVDGVISAVGQRTITFQMEGKGKVREEVVGVDDKTKIEKDGSNVKLVRGLAGNRQGMDQLRTGGLHPGADDQGNGQR